MCLARTLPIVYASIDYAGMSPGAGLPEVTIVGLWTLALVTLVTIGVAAPLTVPLLIFQYQAFDERLQTETLGTDVLLLLLLLFWIGRAGAQLSVDAWLLNRGGSAAAPLRLLYALFRIPRRAQLPWIFLAFFTAYAVMSFGAVLFHLDDPLWRSGDALRLLFTSSYLSRFWAAFRDLEAYSPTLLQAVSIAGIIGQVAFQLFMLPLIWTRWGARFVVWWGALFFTLSLVVLQLSYLPLLEMLFWTALFRRPRSTAPEEARHEPWLRSDRAHKTIMATAAAMLLAFAMTGVPYLDGTIGLEAEGARRSLAAIGLEVPYVLNRDDLRMGDAWPVLYRREAGRRVLLPYHGRDGERLAWLWNDLFYFGNSLKWRREFNPERSLAPDSDSVSRLVDVALYDHRRRGAMRSEYLVKYFATQGSNPELNVEERFERRRLGRATLVCTGEGGSASCSAGSLVTSG